MNTNDFLGDFIDKKCPKCGSTLLGNKVGDEWCSFTECDFGCEDFYNELKIDSLEKIKEPQTKSTNKEQEKSMILDRETLRIIKEAAEKHSNVTPNHYWINAYDKLALAADRLDAMLVRSEVQPGKTISNELDNISEKISDRRS